MLYICMGCDWTQIGLAGFVPGVCTGLKKTPLKWRDS